MRYPLRAAAMAALALALGGAVVPHARADDTAASEASKHYRPTFKTCLDKSGGVTAAMNSCIGTEHDYQDKRLNTAYQSLRKSLDPNQRNTLRDEERQWIASRDKDCAPDNDGGTAALLEANECALGHTADRATELEGRMKK